MNTVGKAGQLGGSIRCVVSVSMLTEGWDANTVTHVLGIRAFGTQLLGEHVIGRALRRMSYEQNEEGLFNWNTPMSSAFPSTSPRSRSLHRRSPSASRFKSSRCGPSATPSKSDSPVWKACLGGNAQLAAETTRALLTPVRGPKNPFSAFSFED